MPSKESEPTDRKFPKRCKILTAAREAFMEVGFERASVDAIAQRASVSKATIYNHFADKNALFVAAFAQEADELRREFIACLHEAEGDVRGALVCVGTKLIGVIVAPTMVSLYRHAGAEAARFPAIGQLVFERGPELVQGTLAAYLERWAQKGELVIDHPRTAAIHFSVLCQGDLYLRAHLGILAYPPTKQIADSVERGVETFLRAYSARAI